MLVIERVSVLVAVIPIERDFVSDRLPFKAFTVKLKVPEAVGLPEITPVEALSTRPLGRFPEPKDHVTPLVSEARVAL